MAAFLWKSVFAEEEPTAEGVSMAATLIGSISFVMCLYYFINYDDADIRQMSWQTISGTISIFCAVLAFSSINDLVEAYVINPIFGEGDATMGALLVDLLHMLLWFVVMQLALAKLSGAIDSNLEQEARENLRGSAKVEFDKILIQKKENMACYAVLLAHITGFASINAFGTVQQIFFSETPLMAFLTPALAVVVMLAVQRLTDALRESVALGDDGTKDEFEDLWDEQCEDAENDVMGLAVSFTFVSALRFAITGCLPNQEGKEEECAVEEYLYKHTFSQKMMLIGSGVAFTIVIFIMRENWPAWLEEEEGTEEEEEAEEAEEKANTPEAKAKAEEEKAQGKRIQFLGRLAEGIFVSTSMSFSWSFFFGFQMILAGISMFEGQAEVLAVTLALLLSAICLGGILPLDWLADQSWTDEHCDTAIRSIMSAMGILIGFGWEQCFDASVDQIAEETNKSDIDFVNPHTAKAGLTLFCCLLLIPAWQKYMIPYMVAEGWNFSFPLRIEDVPRMAKEMIGANNETDEDALPHDKAFVDGIAHLVNQHKAESEKVYAPGVKSKAFYKAAYEESQGFQLLAGDDVAALKKQNADLRKEADDAKIACLKAQKMLDSTIANMYSSMKNMNETVARIESNV